MTTNSKTMSHALNKPQNDMKDYEVDLVRYQARSGLVCQWRKANQIHKWFVDNVQGGNDNCGTYDVMVEELQALLDTVNKVMDSTKLVDGTVFNGYSFEGGKKVYHTSDGKVMEDTSVARELLPTQSGFFFGGTEYDQYYWQDLVYTKERLEKILGMVEEADDGYHWQLKGEDDWFITFQYSSSW